MLEVNVNGTMLGCKLALQRLLPRNTGHIVNVASAAGKIGLPGGVTYSATSTPWSDLAKRSGPSSPGRTWKCTS